MFPNVVCRTCGFPLGALYPAYEYMLDMHNKGQIVASSASSASIARPAVGPDEPIGYILDMLCIRRKCCRTCIMTNAKFCDSYNAVKPASLPATVSPKDK